MCAVLQTVKEGLAFVMDAKTAAEAEDGVVVVQGQGFQEISSSTKPARISGGSDLRDAA